MASSSCVRLVAIHHPFHHQHHKPKPMSLPMSSLTRDSYLFAKPLLITGEKHKLQFLSPKTLRNPYFSTSKVTALRENTSSSENTPENKIPAAEICLIVSVYIIPFLNRLNLLYKFPVLNYAMSPIMPLLGFYQSVPTLGLVVFLALFTGFIRYRNFTKLNYTLQAMVMDCAVVIASLVRPFFVNPGTVSGGASGFKFQLLNVLELLAFQTCIHSCLEHMGAALWVGEKVKVNVSSDVPAPSIATITRVMEVVIKTGEDDGRRVGKSLVLKLLNGNHSFLSDMISAETCNKNILSLCQSCSNSLLYLFRKAEIHYLIYQRVDEDVDEQISVEVDNLLWLLGILVNRQAAEKFALMWANQQKLANLHKKFRTPSRHHVSCITTQLLDGIGNGKILLAAEIRKLLLETWIQPLVDDYPRLRKLQSFDPKEVEENIEKAILELTPEAQQTVYPRPRQPDSMFPVFSVTKGITEGWEHSLDDSGVIFHIFIEKLLNPLKPFYIVY
ncbi:hypothetical protein C5167_020460 [Papaver somniferum]|uniref:At3g05675-like ankyrin-like domain-containing protein n=1 Tax=Papaver somniferum TaxID=3469 RepID=A0A4Y7IT31_PAPSO|nr:hypothetical protein C5167_020460 [Papaver somniferum]